MSYNDRARIELGVLGRWIVVNAAHPDLAWSGSRWVPHDRGIPTSDWQVSNFAGDVEARAYAMQLGLLIDD